MKFPQSPPAWQPLMDRAIQLGKAEAFMEFSHQENLKADRYLHWDDFRHRASDKDGLAKEEQWAAVQMGRAMRSQPIPLQDTQGRAFTFFLTSKAFGLLREIDLYCGWPTDVPRHFQSNREKRHRGFRGDRVPPAQKGWKGICLQPRSRSSRKNCWQLIDAMDDVLG